MAKIKGVSIGENVYWVDPEGITNGWYKIVSVDGVTDVAELEAIKQSEDDPICWEDAIVGMENDSGSYAEAWLCELRFGKYKSRRKDVYKLAKDII